MSSALRPLRRDAARNRRLILDAALELFAEKGLVVGYDEIARRAGVGVGTVYRRFPDREDLVVALFDERIGKVVEAAQQALGAADGWAGLTGFLEHSIQARAADRGLHEVLSHEGRGHETVRTELTPAVEALVARAQGDGTLRPDVSAHDLAALSMAIGSMATASQPELWRRYLALVLDGLHTGGAARTELPLPAPAGDELDEVARAVLHRH